ncbi:hypothetical protein ACTNEO_05215 [Gracilibacillus sp. HCP3S3_G5_1]|uniref:hypothetical protein n=1 Tax=unclassified Gracilibacillus TaxID=2625209 RepID=UPI003F8C363F
MLPSAEVSININEQSVKEFIEQELSKQVHQQLLFVDIKKLSEITCMSQRFLEEEILHDPRIRIHERRKNRKRWWVAQPTFQAIEEIVSEW